MAKYHRSSPDVAKPAETDPRTVADRLHSAAIHLLRRLRRQDEASGLTPARGSALSVVVFGGPMPLTSLADAEQVSAATMSRLVAGLERDGLVQRRPDDRDGRIRVIEATPRGARLLQHGRDRRVAVLTERLARLNRSEQQLLADAVALLERVARAE